MRGRGQIVVSGPQAVALQNGDYVFLRGSKNANGICVAFQEGAALVGVSPASAPRVTPGTNMGHSNKVQSYFPQYSF